MLVNSNNEVEARLIETGRTVEQSWQVTSGLSAVVLVTAVVTTTSL